MKVLPDLFDFEWDQGNREKNFDKHGVTNKEAEEATINKPPIFFPDEHHSGIEKRYGVYGKTDQGRLLSIVLTIRKGKIRVITARDMSKKERRAYEKIKTDTGI